MYRLELAGGLGAILLLLGVLTAIYKCYNMEMMLCYRRYFGNVTEDDSKEYDAYISYTKVDLDSLSQEISEEEQFALEILPDVLENHYGYKLFIPDRDLIPTSMYVEDLTRGVEQSRRLILILTPEFVARRGWSIFQLETRLHSMLVTGDIKVIMIECNDLHNIINYQELVAFKHMIKVLSVIKWQGPKSNPLKSKFWKQVIYEMPLKKKETLSRRQVMDSGEQSLFGDMQAVSSIAVSATSPSVVRRYGEIPDFNQQHYCYGYEYEIPASSMQPATLGNQHMYNNIPMKLLSGQVTQNNTGRKPKQEIPLNSTFVPLLSRELTSDIW